MKFSHSLQFNAVPEWSSKYLSYSSLKKLIYSLQKQSLLEKSRIESRVGDEENLFVPVGAGLLPDPVTVFVQALDKDLAKIDEFFKLKESELYEDLIELAQDVEDYQNEVRLKKDVMRIDEDFEEENTETQGNSLERVHSALDRERPSFSRISSDLNARGDMLSQTAPEIYGDVNDDSDEDDDEIETSNLLRRQRSNDNKLQRMASAQLSLPEMKQSMLINSVNLRDSFIILSDIKITLKKRIVVLYTLLKELKSFIDLNHTGFKKILKKFDKTLLAELQKSYMEKDLIEKSYIFKPQTAENLNSKISTAVKLYSQIATGGSISLAESDLKLHLREHVVWERNTVWRDMINIERKSQAANIFSGKKANQAAEKPSATQETLSFFNLKIVLILLISGLLLIVSPFKETEQKNCFALLIGASMCWATEAIPLFVTSLAMPLLVILLRVLKYDDPKHEDFGMTMQATDASKYIFSTMWSSVIMLLLGGFTLAAALSKYSITRIISTMILSKSGTNPNSILLTIMFISLIVSAVVSNVAAPVLCYSIISPLLRTIPTKSNFAKSLILGIAFASNLGGIASPISSPQNIIAIEMMSPQPSWIQWFIVSVPVSVISLLLIWIFLIVTFKASVPVEDEDTGEGPVVVKIAPIVASKEKFSPIQWYIIFISVLTIGLWCFANQLSGVFGEIGMISLIPIVLFFGSGILTSEDWNNFLWTIVALAMGGIALGKAVSSSGLLRTIAIVVQQNVITGLAVYQVCLIFGFLCLVISTFISHTVSALILLPLIKEIGETMQYDLADGGKGDYSRLLIMLNVFLCSIAMGLPTSGFPNVTAICMTDQVGRSYVTVKEFITRGVPSSLVSYAVVVTIGYLVMEIIHL